MEFVENCVTHACKIHFLQFLSIFPRSGWKASYPEEGRHSNAKPKIVREVKKEEVRHEWFFPKWIRRQIWRISWKHGNGRHVTWLLIPHEWVLLTDVPDVRDVVTVHGSHPVIDAVDVHGVHVRSRQYRAFIISTLAWSVFIRVAKHTKLDSGWCNSVRTRTLIRIPKRKSQVRTHSEGEQLKCLSEPLSI